jgi:hypothetical protein
MKLLIQRAAARISQKKTKAIYDSEENDSEENDFEENDSENKTEISYTSNPNTTINNIIMIDHSDLKKILNKNKNYAQKLNKKDENLCKIKKSIEETLNEIYIEKNNLKEYENNLNKKENSVEDKNNNFIIYIFITVLIVITFCNFYI